MIKLLYKPVDLIASMVGGLLAGLIFKRVWKLIGQGDAPKPTDERRGWGEILLAAMLQGAIFALPGSAMRWPRWRSRRPSWAPTRWWGLMSTMSPWGATC